MNPQFYPKMSGEKISTTIRDIIDAYFDQSISASDATANIEQILCSLGNRLKIRKKGKYTSTFVRKMGKERLAAFEQLYDFKKKQKKAERKDPLRDWRDQLQNAEQKDNKRDWYDHPQKAEQKDTMRDSASSMAGI